MTVEPSRVGEVTHYVANIGKARALLDYTPRYRFVKVSRVQSPGPQTTGRAVNRDPNG